MSWHFFPITLQYLIGGAISLAVTLYVFSRNPRHIVSFLFFSFGLITTLWMFSVFAARNAPGEASATILYRIIMFCFTVSFPLLLVTLLSIRRFHKRLLLILLPGLLWGAAMALGNMFRVTYTDHGWSYAIIGLGASIGFPINLGYLLGVVIAGMILIRHSPTAAIAKKYKLIIAGCLIYFIPLIVTNSLMWKYPWIIPIGGILLTIEFLFIAYAVLLPARPITVEFPLNQLTSSYTRLINSIQEQMPGQALGESHFKFFDFIEAMGLGSCVQTGNRHTWFDPDRLTPEIICDAPGNIIRLMKIHDWLFQAMDDVREVLATTYTALMAESAESADRWCAHVLGQHGGFLMRFGLLTGLPAECHLPADLLVLEPGKTYYIEEQIPQKAYSLLHKCEKLALPALCITKLPPEYLRSTYQVGRSEIIQLSFEPSAKGRSPKDIDGIVTLVSAALQNVDLALVLLDGFDQIKFANGLTKATALLKHLNTAVQNERGVLILSIPPGTFQKQEQDIFSMEAETGLVRL